MKRHSRIFGINVVEDAANHGFIVTQCAKRHRDGSVDDLEHPAAGELLVLHQRDVGLDAGRVAIHQEADGARRRKDRDLGVAIAVARILKVTTHETSSAVAAMAPWICGITVETTMMVVK